MFRQGKYKATAMVYWAGLLRQAGLPATRFLESTMHTRWNSLRWSLILWGALVLIMGASALHAASGRLHRFSDLRAARNKGPRQRVRIPSWRAG